MALGDLVPDVDLAGRYLIVSAMNVLNHQLVLFLGNSVFGWRAVIANIIAATVAAIPAYLFSRRWVWRSDGDPKAQILPFWLISLAGLVVSTALAAAAEQVAGAGLVVNAGALVGYFIVWVAKFFLLDRLFRPRVAA